MLPLSIVTLLFNGLTLALALGFLIIILWHDVRRELNQFFALFLFLVTLWNAGSLLLQAAILVDPGLSLVDWAVSVMEIGFTGSSVAIYVLTTVLIGTHTRRFRLLAFTSLLLVISYQLFLIVNKNTPLLITDRGVFTYQFQGISVFFYVLFDGITFYLVWRYRRKIQLKELTTGILLFTVGQSLGFLSPELPAVAVSTNLSSLGVLILSFGIIRLEMITPLADRISQVEAIHQVTLAITSQIAIDTVLDEIASQAAQWLGANASGIFLIKQNKLELATVYNLPKQFISTQVALGDGVAGSVAATHQSIYLENYKRDWSGKADLPLAKETFGSVICVPLIYGGNAIGVLMVIAGSQGRLFRYEDVHLLELLGAQAAVAIAHSHLFAEQHQLTQQVESARSQLETVLESTENPVIAVDRKLQIIFANPAARKIFTIPEFTESKPVNKILPGTALPPRNLKVFRDLRRHNVHIYEITHKNRIYLCHLAKLGQSRMAGWVAVLNDITQLKELDRLKSEMVRWASHDLKNPLTGALLHLELLAEDLTEIDNIEIHETVNVIQKQLERMNRIIYGILDLERLKVGTLTNEICYPPPIVKSVIEEIKHLADDKQINLTTEIEENLPGFWGDTQQFERAIINLLENAIKFTPAQGQVCLSARKKDNQIIFEIKDNGIGIPDHLQKMVFDRFFRGGQKGQKGAEHISGSGLGLSLVKTIIESHNGTVWVESEESNGSTFYVALPVANKITS